MVKNSQKSKRNPKRTIPLSQRVKATIMSAKMRKVVSLNEFKEARMMAERGLADVLSPVDAVEEGVDVQLALYSNVQQLMALLAQVVIGMPELRKFGDLLDELWEIYAPSFPPMSPISNSFYAFWTLFDLRIEDTDETLADLVLTLIRAFGFNLDFVDVAEKLAVTRMGVYECENSSGEFVVLRELVSGELYTVCSSSGYEAVPGELWFVRLAPPICSTLDCWIAVGTPYILLKPEKLEWISLFEKHGILAGDADCKAKLHTFLKFGLSHNYWAEFIFWGYANFVSGAIFLMGLPDQPESLPCNDDYDGRYGAANC
jgi:hypothetical protein